MQFISPFGHGSSRSSILLIVSFTVVIGAGGAVWAQEVVEPPPTPAVIPTPIPGAEIPGRAAAIRIQLRNAVASTDVAPQVAAIAADFEREKARLEDLTEETRLRLEAEGPSSVIEETRDIWVRSISRLDQWLSTLEGFATTIARNKAQLEGKRQLWSLTRDAADEEDLPEALRRQVEETLQAISLAEEAVRTNRDAVLTLQSAVADEKSTADETLAEQKEEITRRRRNIIGIDSSPLLTALGTPGIHGTFSEQIVSIWSDNVVTIRTYIGEHLNRVVWQAIFLAILVVGLAVLRRRAAVWAREDSSLKQAAAVLDRPIAAGLIVTILFVNLLDPQAPQAWINAIGLLFLVALVRQLPMMLPGSMRLGGYLLALLYFLVQLTELAQEGSSIQRAALLVLAVAAAASSIWLFKRIRAPETNIPDGPRWAVCAGLRLVCAAFVVSGVANVIGSVGLSSTLVMAGLAGVYAGVAFWVADLLLRATVRVALRTRTLRSLGMVREHADTVERTMSRLIRVFAVVGWIVMTLQGSGALDWVVEALQGVLTTQFSIGDFSFVPGDIVIFIVVVWASFKISRLIRFALDADLMPRMHLDRGVSGAVDRLSHYTIVVIGVMIAATAAGLDFSRINLIVGALGVGIGFGLQNVVNNFVSGLILLFERPVRIGDRIQLNTLDCEVKDIGMRASVVRTRQGAEIIVPNANLISSEVTNWTLSDDRRRMDLSVGVAYGTDPEAVIELLLARAEEHPEVLSDPKATVLFLGFGASSLDFEVRAWTRSEYRRISSELLVAINTALVDAGIEIPFPQRDLHLRSVDDGAAKSIADRASPNGVTPHD